MIRFSLSDGLTEFQDFVYRGFSAADLMEWRRKNAELHADGGMFAREHFSRDVALSVVPTELYRSWNGYDSLIISTAIMCSNKDIRIDGKEI